MDYFGKGKAKNQRFQDGSKQTECKQVDKNNSFCIQPVYRFRRKNESDEHKYEKKIARRILLKNGFSKEDIYEEVTVKKILQKFPLFYEAGREFIERKPSVLRLRLDLVGVNGHDIIVVECGYVTYEDKFFDLAQIFPKILWSRNWHGRLMFSDKVPEYPILLMRRCPCP